MRVKILVALLMRSDYLSLMQTKQAKKQTVKILGFTVKVGSKKHAALLAQVKHFNDLASH